VTPAPPVSERRWLVALGVSAAVHLLVGGAFLLAARELMPVHREPPLAAPAPAPGHGPMRVRFLGSGRAPPAAETVAAAAPHPSARAPVPDRPRGGEAEPTGSGVDAPPEATGAAPAGEAPGVEAAVAGVPGAEAGGAGADAPAGGPGGASATGASRAAGPSKAELDAEVHAKLAAAAERCYPPAARRFRLQGVTGVRFCLDAAGALGPVSVERASGADLLDAAARDCVVSGAAPFPAAAAATCFSVPVRFGH